MSQRKERRISTPVKEKEEEKSRGESQKEQTRRVLNTIKPGDKRDVMDYDIHSHKRILPLLGGSGVSSLFMYVY